jgi:hypothetical protein
MLINKHKIALIKNRKKELVRTWNSNYKVGQHIALKANVDVTEKGVTLSKAELIGGGSAVIYVKTANFQGVYDLDRVTAI